MRSSAYARELARILNAAHKKVCVVVRGLTPADQEPAAQITVTSIWIVRLKKGDGSYRCTSVELWLGDGFRKFNGNNGLVNKGNLREEESLKHLLSVETRERLPKARKRLTSLSLTNAFTQYTLKSWQERDSGTCPHWPTCAPGNVQCLAKSGEAIVCEIQGVGSRYTDLTVHTQNWRFGATDLGEKGFDDFLRHHKCNRVCRKLKLQYDSQHDH